VKTIVVSLLNLLLVAAQTLAATGARDSTVPNRAACCGCGCGGQQCCMTKSSAPAPAQPASPAPSVSQNQTLLLLPAAMLAQATATPTAFELSSAPSLLTIPSAVPVFRRNCIALN
jgi:hypothetical protein